MSQQQQQQQQNPPSSSTISNNNNAWTQGNGWNRVAANAPMQERRKPVLAVAPPKGNPNINKSNNTRINPSKSSDNNKSNVDKNAAKKKNKKHQTTKPPFANNKKQKQSGKTPDTKPKTKPIILLQPSDFPALKKPPPVNNVIVATTAVTQRTTAPTFDSSQFPSLTATTATPISTSTNSSNKNNNNNQQHNKHAKTKLTSPVVKKKTTTTTTTTTPKPKQTFLRPSSTTPPTIHEQEGQEHALLRLMQQGKMVVVQKGRQRIKPRMKKFSPLKKKVLEERLRQWRTRQNNNNTNNTSTTVAVLGFVTPDDDWSDDDEYQEICDNFYEMAKKVGDVQRVWIPRQDNSPVYVQFQTPQTAEEAVHAWNGLTLGGTVLRAMALSSPKDETSIVEEEAWQKWCEQAFQENQASMMQVDAVHEIGLWNALTEDDLEDDECLEESVNDIRVLATSYGPLETLRVEKGETPPRVVLVYTCNLHDAKRIAVQLNQVTLSGNQLLAKVLRDKDLSSESSSSDYIVVLRNVLTAEDLEDEECLEESMGDIEELAKQFGVVEKVDASVESQTISVQYTCAEEKAKALAGFQGMVIGGLTVSASTVSGSAGPMEADAALELGEKKEETETMFSGDKRIPERFAECKRVPKIPNSGQPRHYAVLSENETVKPLLTEMLAELMRLQKRAAEDKNAKARRRLVMGLREVARGIRARKVRMVVMANNLDEYGALDDKLQEILDLAQKEEIPVFFEFTKRALGKAIGKTIKIAIIGIQNPDGANQQFKKLSMLAPTIPVQVQQPP